MWIDVYYYIHECLLLLDLLFTDVYYFILVFYPHMI